MQGAELRSRLDQLQRPYTQLAPLLGLSVSGLHKQMNGATAVSRQTEMLLGCLEQGASKEGRSEDEPTAKTSAGRPTGQSC
jgi:hypothetical protein